MVRHSQLGADGHPERGDFLPPVPLPRRMFAGKRITFHEPLRVGDEVKRESTIKSVTPKNGRSGQMVFVTVKTDMIGPRGLAVTEEQDIVYREEPAKGAPPPAAATRAGHARCGTKIVTPDPVMLFRYSALTFNGHRIHYDHPYVTQVEGYPELVMNGGLHHAAGVRTGARARADAAQVHVVAQRAAAVRQPPDHAVRRTVGRRQVGQAVGARRRGALVARPPTARFR